MRLWSVGVALTTLVIAACAPPARQIIVVLDGEVDLEARRVELLLLRADEPLQTPEASLPSCETLLSLSPSRVEFPEAIARVDFPPEAPLGLGHQGDGDYLVLARAWSEGCRLSQACRAVSVDGDLLDPVRLELRSFLGDGSSCPSSSRCDRGRCLPCDGCCFDNECSDGHPATTDVCSEGLCEVIDDLDGDGYPAPQDCDDRAPETLPGAPPDCTRAVDQDCDGTVDTLDGCGAPFCQMTRLLALTAHPELRSRAIASAGRRLVLALDGDGGAPVVWVGTLEGAELHEEATLPLPGVEAGSIISGLLLLGEVALVTVGPSPQLHLVDLSIPSAPVSLSSQPLEGETAPTAMALAPPMLWVTSPLGLELFDVSQAGALYPEPVTAGLDLGLAPVQVMSRQGITVVATGAPELRCGPHPSAELTAEAFAPCFTATAYPGLEGASLRAFFLSKERELIIASGTGSPELPTTPLLWVVRLGPEGLPDPSTAAARFVPGEPNEVIVAGGTILRSTDQGLFLHWREGFGRTDLEPWTLVDLDQDVGTAGPPALAAAVIDQVVVVAAGEAGTMVLELGCAW